MQGQLELCEDLQDILIVPLTFKIHMYRQVHSILPVCTRKESAVVVGDKYVGTLHGRQILYSLPVFFSSVISTECPESLEPKKNALCLLLFYIISFYTSNICLKVYLQTKYIPFNSLLHICNDDGFADFFSSFHEFL